MSEYFVWITIPDLPVEDDERWEPFISKLEDLAGPAGPILSWDGETARVIFSFEGEDEAEVAKRAVAWVSEALRATALGDHYPSHVEVEASDAPDLQPA